jgi:hypothetical protein
MLLLPQRHHSDATSPHTAACWLGSRLAERKARAGWLTGPPLPCPALQPAMRDPVHTSMLPHLTVSLAPSLPSRRRQQVSCGRLTSNCVPRHTTHADTATHSLLVARAPRFHARAHEAASDVMIARTFFGSGKAVASSPTVCQAMSSFVPAGMTRLLLIGAQGVVQEGQSL